MGGVPMNRNYEYRGYEISVSIETDFTLKPRSSHEGRITFVSIVRIAHTPSSIPVLSPLRLGDNDRTGFASEADALMAGCTAGKRIIDDLFATSASLGTA